MHRRDKEVRMEVDPPSTSHVTPNCNNTQHGFGSRDLESNINGNGILAPGTLKRSSSAPMINVLVSSAAIEIRYTR